MTPDKRHTLTTHTGDMMKRLLPTTMRSYNLKQLLRHLDRLQSKLYADYNITLYRIDYAYSAVYKTLSCDHTFYYSFSICDQNKDDVIEAINTSYIALGL